MKIYDYQIILRVVSGKCHSHLNKSKYYRMVNIKKAMSRLGDSNGKN